ncbi:callose synthase 9 [Quercus suber]|uniref:1,3-beta-glucan synthase n=1 Tax=Quercus suber TaxID=58331 RepID=A0AAW0JCE2_QUESU
MAQNLDPSSDGRGVLQFKTGLMSVIKNKLLVHVALLARILSLYHFELWGVDYFLQQKLAKRDGARIDRNRDAEHLWEFYQQYKRRYRVDDIQREEQKWLETGALSVNIGESLEMRKVIATLRALVEVMEALSKDADPGVGRLIIEELRRIERSDGTLSAELLPYNIVPLEAPSLTNAIRVFPEKDNVRNQRENVVLTIANAQTRLGIPVEADPEAARNNNGKAAHSAWRNYDDFNEYFWSKACFELNWPMRSESTFLLKPSKKKRTGKSTFVEHRTYLHLYRSFHRLWIFLVLMFQALTIIAFNGIGKGHPDTFKLILSIGPTFAIMNFIEICLDVLLMFGAYKTARAMAISRLVIRFLWGGLSSVFVTYVYVKVLQERNDRNSNDFYFRIYILVVGVYAALRLFLGLIVKVPACHSLSAMSDQPFFQFFKWIYQERYYVGRGLYERMSDYCRLYHTHARMYIKPLVKPTRLIRTLPNLEYSWHDLISKNNNNVLTIASLWAPVVAIYLMDIHIWYTLLSAVVGGIMGARARLGEIRSIEMVHKRFESFPEALVKNLVSSQAERERDLLSIPSNTGSLRLVQWPLFLLSSKILLAIDLALDCKDTQADLWNRICRDEYMAYAVQECYFSIEKILYSLVDGEGRLWVERIFREINNSISEGSLVITLSLKQLPVVLSRFTALTGLLKKENPELARGAAKALYDLYEVVTHELLSSDLREQLDTWNILARARNEGRLFSRIKWPEDPEIKEQVRRLHLLLTVKDSADNVPKNIEARRRLEFFTNSLFMDMPSAKPVSEMMPFSETVLYSNSELRVENEDGISVLFYLQKIFPDEWDNFLERIDRAEATRDAELQDSSTDSLELRFWASYRGQTLARTEESGAAEGKVSKEFYSKLVKADIHGKDQEIYSIKLPGDPKLGEGKPENQNHAIIFTRGEAVQTIDMNQDNYLEEAMKMRNLLEEFHGNHGIRPPTILGVRENVFTGSVSSLAWFMSNQETSFVTLGQRVLASPLKVRMHYGHPDVFDRIFHVTRGGISKASRVINISEDIYAGFNSTLRQGNITHHEYIQVGKGRDVGLNQIALFEGKVAGGNGEQVLSRDIYRLGQLFDFFRMLSFFFTTVGYYVCTMMTVLTIYIFLYGRVYLAFSGLDEAISKVAKITGNSALDAALNAQFLVQIGIFTAVPMIMGFILEMGLLKAVFSFITMQLQLCSVFFTFSLGTRTHYFGRTILHGGAKYRATGRGFVVRHIKFADNYRLYSRSHFTKALEVALLLIVYIAYGYTDGGAVSFVLLTVSSWFLVLSWLFAPYIFNPSGFEWQKTVEDFDDWTSWLMYKGGVYGFSWVVLVAIVLIFKVFAYSPKKSSNFQLLMRFTQGVTSIVLVAAVSLVVIFTDLSIPDLFACILAFIPTGWGIICLAIAWKRLLRLVGVWDSVREFARMYDAGMGMLIFAPIAVLSWFPFVSTFQSRLLFNQAFSRGLEISLILAGNKANVEK